MEYFLKQLFTYNGNILQNQVFMKVKKPEVVAEKYHFGKITSEGILSYTTHKGTLDGFILDPHDLILDYEGLQQQILNVSK